MLWFTNCAGLCDKVINLRASCGIRLGVTTATNCECHETTLRSKGKIPRMNQSIKQVPSWISTAICGATLNVIRVFSLQRRRCGSINPSRGGDSFVSVRNCGTFVRLMRLVQFAGTIDERMWLAPAPVSTRHFAACRLKAKIL